MFSIQTSSSGKTHDFRIVKHNGRVAKVRFIGKSGKVYKPKVFSRDFMVDRLSKWKKKLGDSRTYLKYFEFYLGLRKDITFKKIGDTLVYSDSS